MHRGMGSAGASQGSGSRVLPGKRMAGNMGNERVTVKNLKVMQVDEKNGLIVVNGMIVPFPYSISDLVFEWMLICSRMCTRPQEPAHQSPRCARQALAKGPDDD